MHQTATPGERDSTASSPLSDWEDDDVGTITLTDLPSELLLLVGWFIAPHGGQKVASLRLSCHHLNKNLAPILFAGIKIPCDPEERDAVLSALSWNESDWTRHITSVSWEVGKGPLGHAAFALSTLPHLTCLTLRGEAPPSYASRPISQQPVPEQIMKVFAKLPKLKTLSIQNLEIVERDGLNVWAPGVTTFTVVDCLGSSRPFHGKVKLRSATLLLPREESQDIQTFRALVFIAGCLPTAEDMTLRWTNVGPSNPNHALFSLDPTTFPLCTLRILEVPSLFASSPPVGNSVETIVALLDFLSRAQLSSLSLPVAGSFVFSPIWSTLRLPHLLHLELAQPEIPEDLLTHSAYTALVAFLNPLTFPALTSLRLAGFLNESGVETPGLLSFADLAKDYVFLLGLLTTLSKTKVVEVRLGYAEGHESAGDSVGHVRRRMFYVINGFVPPLTLKELAEPVSGELNPSLPTLVFFHVSSSRLEAFSSVWADVRLRDAFNVVAFDAVLHGRTTAGERDSFTIEDSADCLLEALERLGFEKYSIVGAGFHGAAAAAWVAIKAPERVQALCLVAPGFFEESSGVAQELHSEWLPLVCKNKEGRGDGSGRIEQQEVVAINDFFFGKVYRQPEVRAATRLAFQHRYGEGYSSHDITHLVHFFFRKRIPAEALASIKVPVLVLHGSEDVAVSPLAAAKEWCDGLKSAKGGAFLHVIHGAPHKLLLTDANVACRILVAFLSRHGIGNTSPSL